MSEATGVVHKQSERRQQGHGTSLTEAQAGGALTVGGNGGQHDTFYTFLREVAVMADALDVQQTSIDLSTDLLQKRQVGDIHAHPEVLGIIDDGFGTQCLAFFEVLLDQRLLVLNVQVGVDPSFNHSRPKPARSTANNLAVEHQLHSIRAAQVQVLFDHGFKELPATGGIVKDLGTADFHLPDRKTMPVTGLPVCGGQGQGQPCLPLVEESLDLFGSQLVAEHLQLLRVLAGEKAVVQRLEVNPNLAQLLFGPFMPIQIDLDGIRHVAANLDEAGAEVHILHIEIVVIDPHRLARPFKANVSLLLFLAGLERFGFLLGDPDENDTFRLCEGLAVLLGNLVLALTSFKVNDRNAVCLSVRFDRLVFGAKGHLKINR
jgi:hypothetical protein